jgi:hypothetical protein
MNHDLALPSALAWPARPAALRLAEHATLQRCLLLAVLLHGLVIAIFGTAPGGSLRQGDSLWGAIEVRLGGVGPPTSAGQGEMPLPYTGPVGRAPQPRWGGEVRNAPAQPSPEPGAAQLGTWNPVPAQPVLREPRESIPQVAEPGPSAAPAPMLTRPEPRAPERREEPAAKTSIAPPVLEPPPRPAPEAAAQPSTAPRLAPAETLDAPVLERPREAEREVARPVPAPAEASRPQAPPAPRREDPAAAVPVAPPALDPAPLTPRRAPVERAPAVPTFVPQPVEAVATPLTPVAPPPIETPVRPPAPPEAQRSNLEPPPAPAQATRASPSPASPVATPAEANDSTRRPPPAGAPTSSREPESAAATRTPADSGRAPASVGSPDAGSRVGTDRATPPSAPASAPTLNLELPRARGALPSTLGSRGLLNLVPPPPERKSKLAEDIEKAGKSDCRTAYSGMGPLAVVPLAIDAAKGSGCKW